MSTGDLRRAAWRGAWLRLFRLAQRYFRFEVEGFEHLRGPAALLVGYHGGPWSLDVFMLSAKLHDELGHLPRAVFLSTWGAVPVLRDMVEALDGLYGPPTEADVALMRARGQHLVVLPGGTREALRPFWRRGRVDFGARRGYLQVALRHGLPVIPTVGLGVDKTFIGVSDGYATSKRLFSTGDIPLWLGLGVGGVWPLAMPFPVRITQRVGAPIDVSTIAREQGLERAHEVVVTTLQAMLDEA